jgi:hypothetical protein
MQQIIITILFTPQTGEVGMTIGTTGERESATYKLVTMALIKALLSITEGLQDEKVAEEGGAEN